MRRPHAHRSLRRQQAAALLLFTIACTPTPVDNAPPVDDVIDQRIDATAPDGVLQLELPEAVIPAGADQILCFIPAQELTSDVMSSAFESVHAEIATHVDAMLSLIPRQPNTTFDCANPQMLATLTPLFLPGAPLPDGMAARIPADKRIVIRTHYVNNTGRDVRVRDLARFTIAADGAREVSTFVVTSTNLLLPPGPKSITIDCVPDTDITLYSIAAHMNGLGKSTRITQFNTEIYRVDAWTPAMVEVAPTTTFDTPLSIPAGGLISLTCEWDNTLARDVTFPEEMCASFSVALPSAPDGLIICGAVAGEGEGEPEDPVGEGEGEDEEPEDPVVVDQSECPGVPPPNHTCLPGCGNDIFVGQPCTVDGGECSDHAFGEAIFCTVDFDETAPLAMCTKPCFSDDQCGDDAVCIGDPEDPDSSKGCVPVACTE